MDNYGYAQLHVNPVESMKRSEPITAATLLGEGRPPLLLLEGKWNHSPDIYDNGLRAHWYREEGGEFERNAPQDYDFEKWDPIYLPCSWNTAKEAYSLYEGSMWFFRKIPPIGVTPGERIILRIGAANYVCMVFLNGEYMGCHEGGFTPFCVDITEHLGGENRLLLWVNNSRRPDGVPGEYTDWMNYGGVYREIALYTVPETHIINHFLSFIPGKDGWGGQVRLEVNLSRNVHERLKLVIPGLLEGERETGDDGGGTFLFHAEPELWSPEHPRLYDYVLSCGKDVVSGAIGFRFIERRGRDLYLNGQRLFLRGITAHEESSVNGRALSPEEQISTLLLAKDMNCNFMRLAHYPHSENMALLADRIGMLLWEEIPVYWALDFGNAGTLANAKNQLQELILRDRNRASVLVWAVGNENPDTDERYTFMKTLIETVRELDPSRLVSAACLADIAKHRLEDRLAKDVDIVGINEYYGWYYSGYDKLEKLLSADFDRPVVVSEFGAEAVGGLHGDAAEPWTEEYQEEVYRNQLKVLLGGAKIAGLTPWLLYDFKTPRRLNEHQKMYNLKGLADRTKSYKKKAYYLVQKKYKEIEESLVPAVFSK